MQKTDFPDVKKPIRENLTPQYIAGLLRQYMRAGEYKLWKYKLLPLAQIKPDLEAARTASQILQSVKDPQIARLLGDTVRDVSPYLHWRQYREIYAVHPDMSRSLIGMGSKSVIPGSILRRLRHPNPLFVTPGGARFTHPDGLPGRILGFFVTGAMSNSYPKSEGSKGAVLTESGASAGRRAAVLLDTHDQHANALHVVVASEVINEAGTWVLDMDMCHLTIPMTAEFTLDGLVEEIADGGFLWAQSMGGPIQNEKVRGYLETAARTVITHLLYACSRTSEIAEGKSDRPPVRRRKGTAVNREDRPAKVREVGYRTGARIENNVRWVAEKGAGASGGSGRTMPFHIRAAHPHLYRVGPGRKEVEIKFLDPIMVNLKDEDTDVATMHEMR